MLILPQLNHSRLYPAKKKMDSNETVSTGLDILSRLAVSSASRTHLKIWVDGGEGWSEHVGYMTLSSGWRSGFHC